MTRADDKEYRGFQFVLETSGGKGSRKLDVEAIVEKMDRRRLEQKLVAALMQPSWAISEGREEHSMKCENCSEFFLPDEIRCVLCGMRRLRC